MSGRRRTLLIATAVLALSIGACGVPREDHPQIVEHKDVPFGLTDTSTTSRPQIPR